MNEALVFADRFGAAFSEENRFLGFLRERDRNGWWQVRPAGELRFAALDERDGETERLTEEYRRLGMEDILTDTKENTGLLLTAGAHAYPVRSCALKTILERAGVGGSALGRVTKPVLAKILNYCLAVSGGRALLRYSEGKISAVHGGDDSEYAILGMPELFETMASYLKDTYPGCVFAGASYDHSMASALWEIGSDAMTDTYREALLEHGMTCGRLKPALRLTTSDVGVSGANIYPMLLAGREEKSLMLGSPLKLEHRAGADLDKFRSQLPLLYAQYAVALGNLTDLLEIGVEHPSNCFTGVAKKIGVPKKLAFEALELFEAQYGKGPCTAHEIYYGLSEVVFLMQCRGDTASRIIQMEENVARAFTVRWRDYDIPGETKW